MAPMTEIKPVTQEDAIRISKEMKVVADNVSAQVDESMRFLKTIFTKHIKATSFLVKK